MTTCLTCARRATLVSPASCAKEGETSRAPTRIARRDRRVSHLHALPPAVQEAGVEERAADEEIRRQQHPDDVQGLVQSPEDPHAAEAQEQDAARADEHDRDGVAGAPQRAAEDDGGGES